jgi:hypothetical protein
MKWIKYKQGQFPPPCVEVLAYNSKWIDKEINPKGIRLGFYSGGGANFISTVWSDDKGCYITCGDNNEEDCNPDYWKYIEQFELYKKNYIG